MRSGKKHRPKVAPPATEADDATQWAQPPVRFVVSASPLDEPSVRATLFSRPPAVLSQMPAHTAAPPAPAAAPTQDDREPGPEIAAPAYPTQAENLHARLRPEMLILPPAWTTTLPDEVPLLLAVYVNGIARPKGTWLSLRPERGGFLLGRARDADMALDEDTVSRRHASVSWQDDAWVLRDLGSTCGTFVNGVVVREARLRDGDRVRLGGTILQAVFDPPIAARVSLIREQMRVVDVLTGLATLPGFHAALDACAKGKGPAAAQLLVVELDDREALKSEHGDVVRDEVLVALADRLRALLPTDAFGARLEEGQFVWWMEAPQEGDTEALVRSVTEGVAAAPLVLSECSLRVTVSVRGALVPRRANAVARELEALRAAR